MKASLLITARDQTSSVWNRILAGSRRVLGGFKAVNKEAAAADRVIDRIGVNAPSRFARIAAAARKAAGTYGLKALEKGAYGAGKGIGLLIRKGGEWALNMAKWGAFAGGAALGVFGAGILSTASDFEQFQVILENTEGSAVKARKAMAWVKQFATTTPYEVADVMEAFVALKAYGLDPMDGTLKSLGNTAAGMNKTIMQAVEMLADAQTGEFERLKEFGVKAKVQGNQVTFTYMKAGKQITATAKNSAKDINKALTGILDSRFAGMMDRQSRTLKGVWSNIKDMASGFQLDIADAGIFDLIKQKAQGALSTFQQWAKDGTLKAWAVKISQALESAVKWAAKFVKETKWDEVGADIATVASAIWSAVKGLAWLVRLGSQLSFLKWLNPIYTSARVWQGLSDKFGGGGEGGQPASRPVPQMKPLPPGKNPWAINRPRAAATPVGGAIDVRLFAAPGTGASVTRMKSANPAVPLRASRGPVRAG